MHLKKPKCQKAKVKEESSFAYYCVQVPMTNSREEREIKIRMMDRALGSHCPQQCHFNALGRTAYKGTRSFRMWGR